MGPFVWDFNVRCNVVNSEEETLSSWEEFRGAYQENQESMKEEAGSHGWHLVKFRAVLMFLLSCLNVQKCPMEVQKRKNQKFFFKTLHV
jgi:hypothetical protein